MVGIERIPGAAGGLPPEGQESKFTEAQGKIGAFLKDHPATMKATTVAKERAIEKGTGAGEIPTTGSVAETTTANFEKMGHTPEAKEVKQKTENTNTVLRMFFSWITTLLSYLNPMAYFNKEKKDIKAEPGADIDKDKEYMKAKPEELSAAAQKLNEYFMEHPEVFKEEGIFRLSAGEKEKKELFNQILRSPEEDLPESLPSHRLAGVFKQIYRELNLFADHVDLLKDVGAKLSGTPAPDDATIIQHLKDLKDALPTERQEDLKNYLEVLVAAKENEKDNKMGAINLAIAAGPNLCDIFDLSIVKPRQEIARQFILHYDEVFGS